MLRFCCPSCRTVLQIEPRYAGARVACSRCRQALMVPAPAPQAMLVSQSKSAPTPVPVRVRRPERVASGSVVSWLVAVLLFLCLTAGGVYLLIRSLPVAPLPDRTVTVAPSSEKEEVKAPVREVEPPARTEDAPAPPLVLRVAAAQESVTPPQVGADPLPQVGKVNPDAPLRKDSNWFVCFPGQGQRHVPRSFPGNEIPDPIPEAVNKLAGYPVTLTFAPRQSVRQVQAQLMDDAGQVVPVWFSSPEKPANPRHPIEQSNTVCLIAEKPLRPGCTFTVSVSAQVDGRPWKQSWQFSSISEAEESQHIHQQALERINHYRKLAGLQPITIDPARSAGCMAHAHYLALNLPSAPELNWHDEDPKRAGASPEGRTAATQSAMFVGGGAERFIDWMMGSFFNRHSLLEPSLRSIGLGFCLFPERGYAWVLNARTEHPVRGERDMLVYPIDGQKDVPVAYNMRSQPLPYPASYQKKEVGYALTLRLLGDGLPTNVSAQLTGLGGKEVPIWISTDSQPAVPGWHQPWIGVVPQTPLEEGTTYTATVSGVSTGRAWKKSWSFTTMSLGEEARSQLAGRLVEKLNRQRRAIGLEPVELDAELSRGCDLHCRFLVRNYTHPSVQGLGQHDEDPQLEGYTPEGRKAGRASVIANDPHPEDAVDNWLSTLYHRISLLHPSLKRVGFGIARLPDQNYMTMIDAGSDVRGR